MPDHISVRRLASAETPKPTAEVRRSISEQLDMPPRAVQVSSQREQEQGGNFVLIDWSLCTLCSPRSGSKTAEPRQKTPQSGPRWRILPAPAIQRAALGAPLVVVGHTACRTQPDTTTRQHRHRRRA